MKQKILLLVLFVNTIGIKAFSQGDTWRKIASLPGATARMYGIAFSIEGKGYFGTGIDSVTYQDNADMWMYDSVANYWTQVSALPVKYTNQLLHYGRDGASAFALNGKGYVIGGYCSTLNTFLKDVWQYNPATNVWTGKNDFPGVGRAYAVAEASEMFGKAYYGTGFRYNAGTGWGTFNDFWEYNPTTDSWISKPAIPTGRGKAAAFTITPAGAAGNCVFVVGGNTQFGQAGYLNDCYKYDIAISTWSLASTFPGVARENPVAFAINNKGYAGLGNNVSAYLKDLYVFDANTSLSGTWSSETPLNAGGRYGSSVFTIGNSAYVVAGLTSNGNVSETWAYSTDKKTWTPVKNADIGVRNGAAGFAINGLGYVAGGYDGGISNSVEGAYHDMFKYDPATDYWSKSNDFTGGSFTYSPSFVLNNVAYLYTPNPNGDGRYVLWAYDITSGVWSQKLTQPFNIDAFFTINNLAYGINIQNDKTFQYNPANNSWLNKADFPGFLSVGNTYRSHGVAFSVNGKGYYGLGNAGNTYFADIWEYNPVTDIWVQKADLPGGGRSRAVSFTIGDYAYAGTGSTASAFGTGDFYRFEPKSNKWVSVAGISGPRQLSTAFVINNKAYVGTGDDDYMSSNNPNGTHKDFFEYTPAKITLPVSLLNFNAVKQGQDVLLSWQTAQEVNTACFNLQRSADGNSFNNIGTVKAAGNSNATLAYNYTDMLIKWPVNKAYYRVQEIDKDGKATLSNTVAIAITLNNKLSIYPNPVKDVVYVQGDKLQSVIVIDDAGRQVIKQNAAGNTIYGVNVSALAAGTYTVKTIDAKGNAQTARMIKK